MSHELAPPGLALAVLPVGTVIDLYGPPGRFAFAALDGVPAPYETRSLPFIEDPRQYHRYRVVREIGDLLAIALDHPDLGVRELVAEKMAEQDLTRLDVYVGTTAPAFGQSGGAVQFVFPLEIGVLVRMGVVEETS